MRYRFRLPAIAPYVLAVCLVAATGQSESFRASIPQPPNKDGTAAPDLTASCWLPDGCTYVRGVIAAHPMIGGLTGGECRKVAEEESLGTMVFSDIGHIRSIDAVLEKWAKQSNHPELRGAAILTGGLSASCLAARAPAYEAPDRIFGVVHVAGGNLHQQEPHLMTGVPFQAHDGQHEEFGPEGGIRAHLMLETQWYMIAEAMMERRAQDPNVLMSLVVVPEGKHGAWNRDLAALFIKKAAQARLPREKRDGSTPAKCVPLTAADGWLTDGALKYTTFAPASFTDYKGDKRHAFWHFDGELARAVADYHHRAFGEPGLLDKVWPLGQRMDVPWKDRSPQNDATVLREWMAGKTGRNPGEAVLRVLAATLAYRINTITWSREKLVREFGLEGLFRDSCNEVLSRYQGAIVPLEKAATEMNLPTAFKDLLMRHYMLFSVWPPRSDYLQGLGPDPLPIPPDALAKGAVVHLPANRTLRAELIARWPAFAEASPVAQILLYDALARFNPCLNREGSFRATAAAGANIKDVPDLVRIQILEPLYAIDPALRPEPDVGVRVETIAVPLADGQALTCRYHVQPERLLLIPDASTLAAMANPPRADLKDVWLTDAAVLKGLKAEALELAGSGLVDLTPLATLKTLRSLGLARNPVRDLAPLKGLPLRELDITGTVITDLTPIGGMPLETLGLAETAVQDLTPLRGLGLKHLDLRGIQGLDLTPLAGMPLESLRLSPDVAYKNLAVVRKIATLKTIGDAPVAAWLKAAADAKAPADDADTEAPGLLPMALPAARGIAPGTGDWPDARGINGSGATTPSEEAWIDEMAHMRKVWSSDAQLPGTLVGNPRNGPNLTTPMVGGTASPVVADGRVYFGYYVPNGGTYDTNLVARYAAQGGPGRDRWYTDADDVLLCIDAATGQTLWRRVFVEAGCNYNLRPNRFNSDMTPCVSDGRVYMLGSRARVYCVDAATGAPLWRSAIGYRTWQADYYAEVLRAQNRMLFTRDEYPSSVSAAKGLVGVLDFRADQQRCADIGDCGVIGFDGVTGLPLWEAPGVARGNTEAPLGWTGNSPGATGFILGGDDEVRFLAGTDGRIAWRVPCGIAPYLATTATQLFCSRPKDNLLQSLAIGPDGAKLQRTGEMALASNTHPAVGPRNLYGHYTWVERETRDGVPVDVGYNGLVSIELATGKVVKKAPCPFALTDLLCSGDHVVAMNDKVALIWNAAGNEGPRSPFPLERARKTKPALAGGRLYVRTSDRIDCFELRTAATQLDDAEVTDCLAMLKTAPLPRGVEAATALRNCGPTSLAAALTTLGDYIRLKSDSKDLSGLMAGGVKKSTTLKELERLSAGVETIAVLARRPAVKPAERDKVAGAIAALLDYGSTPSRLAACRALEIMGPAASTALSAVKKAYMQAQLQEALLAAARAITGNPNYKLTVQVDFGGGLDMGLDF